VPDDAYDARRVIAPPPVGWDAEPYGLHSVGVGDYWAASNSAVLTNVPSVIIADERNMLINPQTLVCTAWCSCASLARTVNQPASEKPPLSIVGKCELG
jgi:hypothetical protein